MLDLLDPRWWPSDMPWRCLYLDNTGEVSAIVDTQDYFWALSWVWKATASKSAHKLYAVRATRVGGTPITVYLHKSILARAVGKPPTRKHTIGDHMNGDSLDCRRDNLRWATPSMNGLNRYGFAARQFMMFKNPQLGELPC